MRQRGGLQQVTPDVGGHRFLTRSASLCPTCSLTLSGHSPRHQTLMRRRQAERCRHQMQLRTQFQTTPASSNQNSCLSGLTTGRRWRGHTGLFSGIDACSSWTWWTTTFGSLFNFWNLASTCRGVVRIKGHPGLGRDQEVSLGKPILAPKSSMTIPQRPTDQFRESDGSGEAFATE